MHVSPSVSTSLDVHGLVPPPTMLAANGGIAGHDDCVWHTNVGATRTQEFVFQSCIHIYSVVPLSGTYSEAHATVQPFPLASTSFDVQALSPVPPVPPV